MSNALSRFARDSWSAGPMGGVTAGVLQAFLMVTGAYRPRSAETEIVDDHPEGEDLLRRLVRAELARQKGDFGQLGERGRPEGLQVQPGLSLNEHIEFLRLRTRLVGQLAHQRWRANFNLTVGLFLSVAGFGILAYVVFWTKVDPQMRGWYGLVEHFVPRMTAVVLIQVFGSFFLSLYRRGLDEVKYFENELTNIESRHIGLLAAMRHHDKAVLGRVVDSYINTDRTQSNVPKIRSRRTELLPVRPLRRF